MARSKSKHLRVRTKIRHRWKTRRDNKRAAEKTASASKKKK